MQQFLKGYSFKEDTSQEEVDEKHGTTDCTMAIVQQNDRLFICYVAISNKSTNARSEVQLMNLLQSINYSRTE